MKKIFTLSVATLAFAACNNSTPQQADNAAQEPTATEEAPMVGDDRDEHGCIQTFEVGTRLNPVDVEEEEAVFSAFIVSKEDDNSQVELFITGEEQNPILKQEADGTFKNGKYTYNAQTKELSIDGKVAYKN